MTNTRRTTLADYSKALDEVYALRRALAFEASVLEDAIALKGYPKTGRDSVEYFIDQMRGYARGESRIRVAGLVDELNLAALVDGLESVCAPGGLDSWIESHTRDETHVLDSKPNPAEFAELAWPEIVRLRTAAHVFSAAILFQLDYKTIPKSKRAAMQTARQRLHRSSVGDTFAAYRGIRHSDVNLAMAAANGPETLTRSAFEAEFGIPA